MKTSNYIFSVALAAATLVGGAANAATYQFRVFALGVRTPPVLAPAAGALAAYESGDFGEVRAGQVAMRDFQFSNTGEAPATGVYPTVDHADLTVSSSTCGVAGAPVTVEGGQSCDIRVTYRPTQFGALTGQLSVQGNFLSAPTSLALTGSAVQEAVGALSPDSTADFGTVPLNTTATRTFTFRNSGNQVATGVYGSVTPVTGMSISANSCGTVAAPITVAGGASCQMTLSYGGSTSSSLNGASVRVSGAFTGSPTSVPLSGSIGAFDATGSWANFYDSTVPLTAGELTFGTVTRGTTAEKTYYVRNTGTSGLLQAAFQLSGDSSQFKIVTIYRRSNAGGRGCVNAGGVIAADGQSSTPCLTDAIAPNVYLTLRYAPTTIGNHSITITPTSTNGSALPAPITVTGSGQFNPTAAWSTWESGYAAMTAAYANVGTVTVGNALEKRFTLANVGTHGAQSVGVALSGDTTHFTLVQVARYMPGTTYGCQSGGAIATGGLSSTPCVADTVAPHVFFAVRYTPKSKGTHTLTLTPSTNNGTVLPAPLVITGTGG